MGKNRDLDDLACFNKERWEELARAGVEYSRPMLDLDQASALHMLDPHGFMQALKQDMAGLDVLCLAAGGGQQSAAFALLGAHVTVFDLSETQLERDRIAAEHYGLTLNFEQGDMRDLGRFETGSFDVVYQAFSLNFIPDVKPVHSEVARVVRPGGVYRLEWSNPFTQTVDEASWTGDGYLLNLAYQDGRDLSTIFPHWDVTDADGNVRQIRGPHEFVHALSAIVNSLVAHGFVIVHASEDSGNTEDPEPGSWPHLMRIAAPYLTLWSRYLPGVIQSSGQPQG